MSPDRRGPQPLHLVFDADDTLWENNLLFERVIERFIGFLDHPTLSTAEVRAVLDDIEARNAVAFGYGSKVFERSLEEAYRALAHAVTDEGLALVRAFAKEITRDPPELIPGVAETLAALGARHDLLLLTKGEENEQRRKIELSQLEGWFRSALVVPEKTPETYRWLIAEQDLDASRTWMIGNSPKSDVNPARAAGLGAVLIPNQHTWVLEHEEMLYDDARTHTVSRFTDLLELF
jgi:putative hydrolase of the HAD superfamily